MECLKGSFWALFFLLYAVDLDVIVTNHGLMSHFYADDSQLYLFCGPDQTEQLRIVTIARIYYERRLMDEVEQAATEFCKDRVSVTLKTT